VTDDRYIARLLDLICELEAEVSAIRAEVAALKAENVEDPS